MSETWAVIDAKGERVPGTLSDTRRGAIMSWLTMQPGTRHLSENLPDVTVEAVWSSWSVLAKVRVEILGGVNGQAAGGVSLPSSQGDEA
jgi:hypothetical protein